MITGQLNLCDALDRTIDFTSDEGKAYGLRPDDELATIVVRPRGWHLDEKHCWSTASACPGSLFDFALYFFHCAQRQLDKGKGPYFYLPKMESHLEARLWNDVFNLAQDAPRHPARHDPGHRADRDHPGRLRDGGDPLRAARPQRGAERGPLGLPVQHHQEVPHPGPRVRAARAQLGHHDGAVHARLHRAAGEDLPRPRRARHGRDGRVHPEPARSRGERDRAGQGARRQDPRVGGRLRRLLGGPPRPGAALPGGLRRRAGHRAQPARPAARGRQRHRRRTCWRSARRRGADHRGRAAQQRQRGAAVPGQLARRQRRGGDLQPDGGRGHRRDLPLADLAVAAQRHHPRRRPAGDPRPGRADHRRGAGEDPRRARRRVRRRPATTRRPPCSPRWRWPTTTPSSSPCPPTSGCPDGPPAAGPAARQPPWPGVAGGPPQGHPGGNDTRTPEGRR